MKKTLCTPCQTWKHETSTLPETTVCHGFPIVHTTSNRLYTGCVDLTYLPSMSMIIFCPTCAGKSCSHTCHIRGFPINGATPSSLEMLILWTSKMEGHPHDFGNFIPRYKHTTIYIYIYTMYTYIYIYVYIPCLYTYISYMCIYIYIYTRISMVFVVWFPNESHAVPSSSPRGARSVAPHGHPRPSLGGEVSCERANPASWSILVPDFIWLVVWTPLVG